MKTHLLIVIFGSIMFSKAQVAVGKSSITTLSDNITPNPSISLEFGIGDRGIILPWVSSAAAVSGAVDGTFIFDTADKKVKYRKNGTWFDLTVDATGTVDTSLQSSLTEQPNAKVIIGSNPNADTTPGILVLSDTNKAMVLPKLASPHLNIISPAPGMMVYDTTKRQIALFNGSVWSFWKP
jgi:hypothetical protein